MTSLWSFPKQSEVKQANTENAQADLSRRSTKTEARIYRYKNSTGGKKERKKRKGTLYINSSLNFFFDKYK